VKTAEIKFCGGLLGRLAEIQVDSVYDAQYTYDAATARLSRVTGPGLPASGTVYGAYYTYGSRVEGQNYDDSDMVRLVEFKDTGGMIASTIRSVEEHRDVLTVVENVNSGTVSKYDYRLDPAQQNYAGADELGRRKSVVRTGSAFSTGHHDDWTYDDRNELETSKRYNNTTQKDTSNPVTTLDREYHYDPIGNRTDSKEGTADRLYYCANGLNQYDDTDNDQNCPTPTESFSYDADGSLIADGTYTYDWDGENRLRYVWLVDPTPGQDEEGDRRVSFTYDYASRRVQKVVEEYDGEDWVTETDRRFVWGGSAAGGWLMLLELNGADSNAVLRKYTWGLDLAGLSGQVNSLESAGGIGGLLAVYDATLSDSYVYFYDGNGNVGQVREAADVETVATYEYDAYGSITSQSGTYYATNPFRFSTKYLDDETGLYYFGYRYYMPRLGRWISRDPIGEIGGANAYVFARNDAATIIDPLGLLTEAECYTHNLPPRAKCLLIKMLKKGCNPPKRVCKCCAYGGYFNPSPDPTELVICINNTSSFSEMDVTLNHEYQHAWQYCKRTSALGGGHDVACAEIQAYFCSGACDPGGAWLRPGETKDDCVKRNAVGSVTATGISLAQAQQYVNANYAKADCKDCTECP
jgi:RHS repeat-associated protein